ncbi:EutN/CcmL family microcompartment protein [Shigella flexneri]|nr:EutN/CcmL family microcompartment protein [Escherichia coli]
MYLAKVIGSIVATQKSDSLLGKKLMLIRMISFNDDGSEVLCDPAEVVVDFVGAGQGETVLVARGSPVRQLFPEPNYAIDSVIVGIVDSIEKALPERG